MLNIDAPSAVVAEIERQERINEDVIRYLTVRVEEHEEGPSAMMRKAERDRERDDRAAAVSVATVKAAVSVAIVKAVASVAIVARAVRAKTPRSTRLRSKKHG